jgi:CBS domain-containing protein
MTLLRAPASGLPPAFEFSTELRAGDIAVPPPLISALTTEKAAIQLMLDEGHDRLVVVDEEGRLVGMLARRGLLRALAQESAA